MFMQGEGERTGTVDVWPSVLEILSLVPRCDLKSLFLIGDRRVKWAYRHPQVCSSDDDYFEPPM